MRLVTPTREQPSADAGMADASKLAAAWAYEARVPAGQINDEGTLVVSPGGSVSGVIDFDGDSDTVSMTLTAGTYMLSLRGTGANPLLDPYLASNNAGVADDDDGGVGINSLITFTVTTSGTYTFDVEAYPDSGLTGGYTVDLVQMGADSVPGTLASTVVAGIGAPNFGFIETGGDVDTYRVTLTAGVFYDFEVAGGADYNSGPGSLPSGELDTILTVYDAGGNVVFTNDDMGDDLSSGGGFFAETGGTYFVEVSTFSAGTGGYNLEIEATDPGTANPLDAIDWGGLGNVAEDGPLNDGIFYVYFAAAGEEFDGVTSLGWTAHERQHAMAAWNTFSTFADVGFATTTNQNQATFTLVTTESDEFLGSFNPPGTVNAGVGLFAIDASGWDRNGATGGLGQGGYGFSTLIHEFGHGLGLAHPHDDGGGSDIMPGVTDAFGSYGLFDLNQGVYTVMSYNDGWTLHPDTVGGFPAGDPDNYGYSGTPMAFDVALLQAKYGAVAHNTGNDVYLLDQTNGSGTFYQCIWDTGGIDIIRYNGSADAIIDLTAATLDYSATGAGVISWVDGIFGGFTIANGVLIENARSGSGFDSLIGNIAANDLRGGTGRDTLSGLRGPDAIYGNAGNDTLLGGSGADNLYGGFGKDTMTGGPGRDQFVFLEGETAATRSAADIVTDFSQAELDFVRLKAIDADTTLAGDQKFKFIGAGAFTGAARELHYVHDGGNTFIEGDTDGDGLADFVIRLNGLVDLTAADFVL